MANKWKPTQMQSLTVGVYVLPVPVKSDNPLSRSHTAHRSRKWETNQFSFTKSAIFTLLTLLTKTFCWFRPDFTSDTCISPHKPSTECIYPLSRLILLGVRMPAHPQDPCLSSGERPVSMDQLQLIFQLAQNKAAFFLILP